MTISMPTTSNRVLAVLQRVGLSFLLPIAVLVPASLLLRFGQPDLLGEDGRIADLTDVFGVDVAGAMAAAGNALFAQLPLLFAIGLAIGFSRRSEGATVLAAVVGWFVFDAVFDVLVADDVINTLPDGTPVLPDMGVLSGILMGIVAAKLFDRYYRVKLPPYLAFFGGRRFVPIITAFAALILGIIFGLIWPTVGGWLNDAGEWIVDQGSTGAGIYGTINRLLIPLGLHHIVNSFMWFIFDGGDLTQYFAGAPDRGIYMAGFFPIMMFGLPAAALAIVHSAPAHRRPVIGGVMLSAALTSFLTGVTEPIEFAFIFVAPLLFVIHAVLTGTSLFIANVLDIHLGFGFSASFIDFMLNFGKSNSDNPWLIWPIGAVYAVIYYVVFRWVITRFNLMTPGREPEEPEEFESGAITGAIEEHEHATVAHGREEAPLQTTRGDVEPPRPTTRGDVEPPRPTTRGDEEPPRPTTP